MSSKFALFALTATLMSEEMIINEIESAISEMKSAVLDSEKKDARMKLVAICNLYSMKVVQEDKPIVEMMDEFDRFESLTKMMNPGGN